jgi:hypothetical protein
MSGDILVKKFYNSGKLLRRPALSHDSIQVIYNPEQLPVLAVNCVNMNGELIRPLQLHGREPSEGNIRICVNALLIFPLHVTSFLDMGKL